MNRPFLHRGRAALAAWSFLVVASSFGVPALSAEESSVPGQYLAVVKPGEDVAAAAQAMEGASGGKATVLWPAAGIVRIDVDPQAAPQTQASRVAAMSRLSSVKSVQPNYRYYIDPRPTPAAGIAAARKPAAVPDDPQVDEQYYLETIGAYDAWDVQKTSPAIVVAVTDQAVYMQHEDLASRIWTNITEVDGNGIDDDANGFVDDVRGWDFDDNDNDPSPLWDPIFLEWESHGTHVAGTIGAEADNGVGIAGITWQVKLMPVRWIDELGFGNSANATLAVRYAVENRAKIINASWWSNFDDTALQAAIEEADDQGVLFVCAAGNFTEDVDSSNRSPANFNLPNQITVAATDATLQEDLTSFSNFGATKVHLAAPGASILSTVPGNDPAVFTDSYAYFDGTSMASPMVAGAAALVWANDPSLTHHEVKAILLESVDVFESLEGLCSTSGRLNLAKALGVVTEEPEEPGDKTFIQNQPWGSHANQSTILAYYQSFYALYEGGDGYTGSTANTYAYYALYAGDLAGARYTWKTGESEADARSSYMTYRYYQYLCSAYAVQNAHAHWAQTGGGYSYMAIIWGYYAMNYAVYDLYY